MNRLLCFLLSYATFVNISIVSTTVSHVELDFEGIRVKYFTGVNDEIVVKPGDGTNLQIVCNKGEEPSLLSVWKTIGVRILSPSRDYKTFFGENETVVVEHYRASQSLLYFAPVWQLQNRADLLVYNKSCVGIHSMQPYKLLLEVNRIDFWKLLKLMCGLFLFFAAPYLSGNVVFYYSSGVTLGICASLLIVVFVVSRFIPKKVGAVGFLVGGWAVVIYILQMLYSNLQSVMVRHQGFVLAYLGIVGFISFAICYRRGHVTDVRSRNLIKWTLQGVALIFIFLSTEFSEVAVSIILIAIVIHACPDSWIARMRTFWKRRFPPKVRSLTEEEYYHQAAVETRRALDQLRIHCRSPDCNSWKMMRTLKTPLRFAEFVDGNSHLTDDEILNYEIEQFRISDRDDDDDDSYSDPEVQLTPIGRSNGHATIVHRR